METLLTPHVPIHLRLENSGQIIQLCGCMPRWLIDSSRRNRNSHIAATRWRRFICKVLIHFIDAIRFPLVVLLFYAISLVWIILTVTNAPDFCGYIAQADSTSVT